MYAYIRTSSTISNFQIECQANKTTNDNIYLASVESVSPGLNRTFSSGNFWFSKFWKYHGVKKKFIFRKTCFEAEGVKYFGPFMAILILLLGYG